MNTTALERARRLRDDLLKRYTDVYHTVEAASASFTTLDSAETKALLGPRAIENKRAEIKSALDSTLLPLIDDVEKIKVEFEALRPFITDPEEAARASTGDRLTSPWKELPENNRNAAILQDEARENVRTNRAGRIFADINEELARARLAHAYERMSNPALFDKLDALIEADGDNILRDVGLVLDELAIRELPVTEITRKASAMAKLARHPIFVEGAKLKVEIGRILDECRLTVKSLQQGSPDLMRSMMFTNLTASREKGGLSDENPFITGNLTKQGQLVKSNPALAAKMKAEARIHN